MNKKQKILISNIAIASVVLVGISFWIGYNFGTKNINDVDLVTSLKNKTSDGEIDVFGQNKQTASTVDFAPFWRTWNILDRNFIPVSTSTSDQVGNDAKVIKAIQGLVSSYNDPYTVFFPPEESKAFKEQTNGSFEGIGAVLNVADNGYVIVTGVLKDMPADRAGIKPGDAVIAIDSKSVVGKNLADTINMVRGPKDTTITLSVIKQGKSFPEDIKVTRGTVVIPSTAQAVVSKVEEAVKRVVDKIDSGAAVVLARNSRRVTTPTQEPEKKVTAKDFFVFGLTAFSRTSTDAFKNEIIEFNKADTNNIIMDLRNNGGGYVDVAVDIASYFLPEGATVFTEKRGKDKEETIYKSKGYKLLKNPEKLKLVILVNKNTASASEILAGALRDYGIATIIGEKTFGKGSMQELINVTDQMSLKVTVARWYTPKGVSISGTGINPDYSIIADENNTKGGIDPVFDKAIEVILKGKDSQK